MFVIQPLDGVIVAILGILIIHKHVYHRVINILIPLLPDSAETDSPPTSKAQLSIRYFYTLTRRRDMMYGHINQ
jgi:hypothetical protein